METGVDQPGAEEVKGDFVRPLEIRGLDLVKTLYVLIKPLAYELETLSQLIDLLGLQDFDPCEKSLFMVPGNLVRA